MEEMKDRIRTARKGIVLPGGKKGLSQVELAGFLGVRQATISDLETGRQKEIGSNLLRHMSYVLGVSADDLIGQYEEEGAEN